MTLKITNNAASKLAAGISSSATALSVLPSEGAKFPVLGAGEWFPATLVKVDGTYEIVKVTARSADNFTIARAQEGTAAQAFSLNDRVELRMTANAFEEFLKKTGGIMLGDLTLAGDATAPLHAVTKQQLDTKLASAGGTTTGTYVMNNGDGFTTFGWATPIRFNQNQALMWRKNGQTYAMGLGVTSNTFYWIRSTAEDASAAPTYPMYLDASGNLTASGNITGFSDETLKTDWAPLADDFIAQLARVKHGTFTRIDSGERQVGVGAQSLRAVLPEAVLAPADPDSPLPEVLSVAYGNAALAAAVALAGEVLALRERLAKLEAAQ